MGKVTTTTVAYEFMLTGDIEVCVAEDGKLLSAMDYRPAFDRWGDCTAEVNKSRELMSRLAEKLADEKALHGE